MSLQRKQPRATIDVLTSIHKYGFQSLISPASYFPAKLDGLTRFINENVHQYDMIAVTGDLATSGEALDIELAGKFIEGGATHPFNQNAARLQLQRCPLILMPGNHDHYGKRANPSKQNFKLRFGRFLKNYDTHGVGHRVITAHKGNTAYAIIYADFSFDDKNQAKNKKHRYGGGFVTSKTLQSLEQRTHKLRRDISKEKYNPVVIWMTHFAPYETDSSSLELTGFKKLIETASRCSIPTILCGHTHETQTISKSGVEIFCAGAATSVDCENVIHEIQIDRAGKIVDYKNIEWQKSDGNFG